MAYEVIKKIGHYIAMTTMTLNFVILMPFFATLIYPCMRVFRLFNGVSHAIEATMFCALYILTVTPVVGVLTDFYMFHVVEPAFVAVATIVPGLPSALLAAELITIVFLANYDKTQDRFARALFGARPTPPTEDTPQILSNRCFPW